MREDRQGGRRRRWRTDRVEGRCMGGWSEEGAREVYRTIFIVGYFYAPSVGINRREIVYRMQHGDKSSVFANIRSSIRLFLHLCIRHSFTFSFVHFFNRSFIQSFVHWFIRSFVHRSFVHSFIVHSFICLFLHSFIRSFVQSLILSTIHLFTGSFSTQY